MRRRWRSGQGLVCGTNLIKKLGIVRVCFKVKGVYEQLQEHVRGVQLPERKGVDGRIDEFESLRLQV